MKEGDVSHEEVNAAVAMADKTIIFARQNRLSDGLVLDDEKLPRFHAGHDSVKFFYSAVRQLPEYFLDALLAKNISVTLVLGKGLLVFKDVRNHQAIHSGRTRRTIYIPEKVLDVAVNNGYDYWSISQVLIIEGWKLLDYALLQELVTEGKRFMLEHSVSVLGWNTMRRLVQRYNKHRSAFESAEMIEKRDKWGLDVSISETGEFLDEYEDKLLKAMRYGGDGRLGREIPLSFRQMMPEDVAKVLYNDHLEEVWARKKAAEICEMEGYPDYFLLDRDIVHPAARELAEVNGQDIAPRDMAEARHDYQDRMRFGIGREIATEWIVEQGLRFAPAGLRGLVEEIVAMIAVNGRINEMLLEWTREGLLRHAPAGDKVQVEMGEDVGEARVRDEIRNLLDRGIDLMRLRELASFHARVKSREQTLELDHLEMLRDQLVELVEAQGMVGDYRRQMILMLNKVEDLFAQLKTMLIAEGKRLIGPQVEGEHIDPPETVLAWIDEGMERAMLQLTLRLELMPGYHSIVERLAAGGSKVTEEVLEEFLGWAAEDAGRQIAVAAARRGMAARQGKVNGEEVDVDDGGLGNLYERVNQIVTLLPERPHTATSGLITPLRKALREFETVRQQTPTHPQQLGPLAMVLVRMDRLENYEELLGHIRWMGEHAVGHLVKPPGGPMQWYYSPGLRKIVDEIGREEPIGTNAFSLIEEVTGVGDWERLKEIRSVHG